MMRSCAIAVCTMGLYVCLFLQTNCKKQKKKLNPLTSDNLYHSVGKQHHVSYADRDFLGCPLYYKPPRVPC